MLKENLHNEHVRMNQVQREKRNENTVQIENVHLSMWERERENLSTDLNQILL